MRLTIGTLLSILLINPAALFADDHSADSARKTSSHRQSRSVQRSLRNWVEASQQLRPLTSAERRRQTFARQERFNGHELSIAFWLSGPVDVHELAKRFEWTHCRQNGSVIQLHGQIRDQVESLFVREIVVTLDADSRLPEKLEFHRPGDRAAAHWKLSLNRRIDAPPLAKSHVITASVFKPVVSRPASSDRSTDDAAGEKTALEYLARWSKSSGNMQTVHVRFHRYIYDKVFDIERRAEGRLYYSAPNRGRLDIEPVLIDPHAVSRRRSPTTGKPYSVKSAQAESFIWAGESLVIDRPHDGRRQTIPLENENGPIRTVGFAQLALLISSPNRYLPFVCGFDLEEAKREFDWNIDEDSGETVRLTATPRGRNKAQWKSISVILDTQTCRPSAIRYIDPAGNSESVFVFHGWRVNEPLPGDDRLLEP